MAPLLPLDPRPEPPMENIDGHGVRLLVRLGAGYPVAYALAQGEFLVGAATGCDVRLPGPNTPPVVCQFLRQTDELLIRRVTTLTPVFRNGLVLGVDAVPVVDGDRIGIGPVEITVQIENPLPYHPRLIPIENLSAGATSRQPSEQETAAIEAISRREHALAEKEARLIDFQQELLQFQHSLQAQHAALEQTAHDTPAAIEADRARQQAQLEEEFEARYDELEAEFARKQDELTRAWAERHQREEALSTERLRAIEAEIAQRRASFEAQIQEYEPRHAELEVRRQQLEALKQELHQREETLAQRQAEFEQALVVQPPPQEEPSSDLAAREENLRQERTRHAEDLVRLERWQATLDSRQQALDRRAAEIDQRFERLTADLGEFEEQARMLQGEEDRLRHLAERLNQHQADLESREQALTHRIESLDAQQSALAVLKLSLDRRQDELHAEGIQLTQTREQVLLARKDLEQRLTDAERLRLELGHAQVDQEQQRSVLHEQQSLLAATLEEIHQQEEALKQAQAQLAERERQLELQAAEHAEQVAILKARATQVLELQQRLEADRTALRERAGSLTEAETARQTLQEQLRKRATDLQARHAEMDAQSKTLEAASAELEQRRQQLEEWQHQSHETLTRRERDLDARSAELAVHASALDQREAQLTQQIQRVQAVGKSVAEQRKHLVELRTALATDQASSDEFRKRIAEQMEQLRQQAPYLESQARASLDRLASARDVLRRHLEELHQFATQARTELDQARQRVRQEESLLQHRAEELDRARAEHRHAVAGFRQQLLDWQAQVADLKQSMQHSESRLEQRQAAVDAAAKRVDATTQALAQQEEALRVERAAVAEKRSEMERHLADMRAWYKKKLRELAAGKSVDDSDMPLLESETMDLRIAPSEEAPTVPIEDLEPGDRHLGELLQTAGLIDGVTLQALWAEARRQRRTLRQMLLVSGAITLYQLALIEAGNLDALILGRLRVIDRIRATPREAIYRVYDPQRRGAVLLRHLGEAEMQDAVRPDEYRQRFLQALGTQHPNLVNTLEVLDIQGRPAVLQELVEGLPASEWPAMVMHPGLWLQVMIQAAQALATIHEHDLVHGQISPETVLMTTDGQLKLTGIGEPPWLTAHSGAAEILPAADFRALGQMAYGWANPPTKKKPLRSKPFPPVLATVIRRLEAGMDPPMADVVAFDRPYANARELLQDLEQYTQEYPLTADIMSKWVNAIAECLHGSQQTERQSA